MALLQSLQASDYAHQVLKLYPTGRAWSRDPDSVFAQIASATGSSYARLDARARYLLTDAFPSTTLELLPEWEMSLGLPDPCAGAEQTIEQRQQQVVARFTQSTGASIRELTAFAAALGYKIMITLYAPARYGRHKYGQPYYTRPWMFAWKVTAPSVTVEPAQYGRHHYGEPYVSFGSGVLECEMQRLSPAHSRLLFAYTT